MARGEKKKHWKKCSQLEKIEIKKGEIRGENGKEKVFSQLWKIRKREIEGIMAAVIESD